MALFAFDFDGTLSDSEMTVLLGEQYGTVEQRTTSGRTERVNVAAEMAEITERAMNDELSYAESLRERASLLEDLPDEKARAAFENVVLRPGAADLLADLRAAGHHVAILTGGFERGVAAATEREGVTVDTIVANRLPVGDDALTGAVEGPLIEGTKDEALADLAADLGVDVEEAIAVGDGANDLPMLQVAGTAIGFEPKPAVTPHCEVEVESVAELRSVVVERGLLAAE